MYRNYDISVCVNKSLFGWSNGDDLINFYCSRYAGDSLYKIILVVSQLGRSLNSLYEIKNVTNDTFCDRNEQNLNFVLNSVQLPYGLILNLSLVIREIQSENNR